MDYVVSGKKGSGKSLLCVKFGIEHYNKGNRVAFNFPVDFVLYRGSKKASANHAVILPDVPTRSDLDSLGFGCPESQMYDEDNYGHIYLDESSRIFNSREWSDKNRSSLLDWLIHARKMRWRVFYICQHPNQLDKQIRESLIDIHIICRRTDKVKVPFLPVKLPKVHVALSFYGINNGANHPPSAGRFVYHPRFLGKFYNSHYIFKDRQGAYCTLPRDLAVTRYKKPRDKFSFSPRYLANLLIFPIALIVYLCFRTSIKAAKNA